MISIYVASVTLYVSVCVICVRTLKEKKLLELSTPNLVHILDGRALACIDRPRGQIGQGHVLSSMRQRHCRRRVGMQLGMTV